jgi:hypothetical protein
MLLAMEPDSQLVFDALQITEGDHVNIVQYCLKRYEYWRNAGEKEVAEALADALRYEIGQAWKSKRP